MLVLAFKRDFSNYSSAFSPLLYDLQVKFLLILRDL